MLRARLQIDEGHVEQLALPVLDLDADDAPLAIFAFRAESCLQK